jgi:hypothetical protein
LAAVATELRARTRLGSLHRNGRGGSFAGLAGGLRRTGGLISLELRAALSAAILAARHVATLGVAVLLPLAAAVSRTVTALTAMAAVLLRKRSASRARQ